ncbi:MAG TPA: ribosomal protein S18-alanine N-acetyltransferase [Nitrospira sp.]|nr:ribosomal protein S18-alanine N-acetyltransferase [Nitrospira sp.]
MTVSTCEILPATPGDLSDIVRIEEACFSAPWTRKMLEAELTGNQFAHFLVARQEPVRVSERASLVGYLCYWIVFEELRFMNLAVIESMRRRGIARSLVAAALHAGATQSAVRAVLEVRSSNQAAQRLYRSFGFQEAGLRPQYYTRPLEDAVLMELAPIAPQPAPGSHANG